MTDKEKLDRALCDIITNSDTCVDCMFKHYFETNDIAFCFFAVDCICNNHKYYKKEEGE